MGEQVDQANQLNQKDQENQVDILIRPLEESDLNDWVAVRGALWPSEELETHKSEISEFVNSDKFKAWGAWHGDQLIGFVETYLRPFANGCELRPVPFLEGIWVHSMYRNAGVAAGLLREAEAWAKASGYSEMGSDVEMNNELSNLAHKKWGFEETERVVYYRKQL